MDADVIDGLPIFMFGNKNELAWFVKNNNEKQSLTTSHPCVNSKLKHKRRKPHILKKTYARKLVKKIKKTDPKTYIKTVQRIGGLSEVNQNQQNQYKNLKKGRLNTVTSSSKSSNFDCEMETNAQ